MQQRSPQFDTIVKEIVLANKCNYVKVLQSKRYKHLVDYIISCTSCLVDTLTFAYKMKTRVYWLLNGIECWESPLVKCSVCGSPFVQIDVKHALDGYGKATCCKSCERKLAQQKLQTTLQQKHGVSNAFQLPSVKQKLAAQKCTMQAHREQTRKKNGTVKASKQEDIAYVLLCRAYGARDVVRQYKSIEYPFNCDFYITTHSMYIECNFSWTHGGHFFDPDSQEDVSKLHLWQSKHSKYYDNAMQTWTVRDVLKRQRAMASNLNYKVFWTLDELKAAYGHIHT